MKTVTLVFLFILLSCTYTRQPINSKNSNYIENKLNRIERILENKKENSGFDKIFTILISFFTAIVVAVVTGFMLRQTEYDKIIYQKRTDIFFTYILDIDKAIRNTTGKVFAIATNKEFKNNQHFIEHVRKDFIPIMNKAIGMKMFLNKEDREIFYKHIELIRTYAIESYMEKYDSLEKMKDSIIDIEKIFEKNLDNITHRNIYERIINYFK